MNNSSIYFHHSNNKSNRTLSFFELGGDDVSTAVSDRDKNEKIKDSAQIKASKTKNAKKDTETKSVTRTTTTKSTKSPNSSPKLLKSTVPSSPTCSLRRGRNCSDNNVAKSKISFPSNDDNVRSSLYVPPASAILSLSSSSLMESPLKRALKPCFSPSPRQTHQLKEEEQQQHPEDIVTTQVSPTGEILREMTKSGKFDFAKPSSSSFSIINCKNMKSLEVPFIDDPFNAEDMQSEEFIVLSVASDVDTKASKDVVYDGNEAEDSKPLIALPQKATNSITKSIRNDHDCKDFRSIIDQMMKYTLSTDCGGIICRTSGTPVVVTHLELNIIRQFVRSDSKSATAAPVQYSHQRVLKVNATNTNVSEPRITRTIACYEGNATKNHKEHQTSIIDEDYTPKVRKSKISEKQRRSRSQPRHKNPSSLPTIEFIDDSNVRSQINTSAGKQASMYTRNKEQSPTSLSSTMDTVQWAKAFEEKFLSLIELEEQPQTKNRKPSSESRYHVDENESFRTFNESVRTKSLSSSSSSDCRLRRKSSEGKLSPSNHFFHESSLLGAIHDSSGDAVLDSPQSKNQQQQYEKKDGLLSKEVESLHQSRLLSTLHASNSLLSLANTEQSSMNHQSTRPSSSVERRRLRSKSKEKLISSSPVDIISEFTSSKDNNPSGSTPFSKRRNKSKRISLTVCDKMQISQCSGSLIDDHFDLLSSENKKELESSTRIESKHLRPTKDRANSGQKRRHTSSRRQRKEGKGEITGESCLPIQEQQQQRVRTKSKTRREKQFRNAEWLCETPINQDHGNPTSVCDKRYEKSKEKSDGARKYRKSSPPKNIVIIVKNPRQKNLSSSQQLASSFSSISHNSNETAEIYMNAQAEQTSSIPKQSSGGQQSQCVIDFGDNRQIGQRQRVNLDFDLKDLKQALGKYKCDSETQKSPSSLRSGLESIPTTIKSKESASIHPNFRQKGASEMNDSSSMGSVNDFIVAEGMRSVPRFSHIDSDDAWASSLLEKKSMEELHASGNDHVFYRAENATNHSRSQHFCDSFQHDSFAFSDCNYQKCATTIKRLDGTVFQSIQNEATNFNPGFEEVSRNDNVGVRNNFNDICNPTPNIDYVKCTQTEQFLTSGEIILSPEPQKKKKQLPPIALKDHLSSHCGKRIGGSSKKDDEKKSIATKKSLSPSRSKRSVRSMRSLRSSLILDS